jgi:RNA polymerase sigma-70 factor, ECF subfamily
MGRARPPASALRMRQGRPRATRVSTDQGAFALVNMGRAIGRVDVEAALHSNARYEELHRAHYARIVRICRVLLANPHDAEDVGQEVFLKLFQACQVEGRPMRWEAWLTRVAVNACRDRRRSGWWRLWRESSVELQEGEIMSAELSPEARAIGRERRDRIWQAVRGLGGRQREVFALRHLEGWSTEAVAATLGLSPGSVKRHLFRAIRRLRTALEVRT